MRSVATLGIVLLVFVGTRLTHATVREAYLSVGSTHDYDDFEEVEDPGSGETFLRIKENGRRPHVLLGVVMVTNNSIADGSTRTLADALGWGVGFFVVVDAMSKDGSVEALLTAGRGMPGVVLADSMENPSLLRHTFQDVSKWDADFVLTLRPGERVVNPEALKAFCREHRTGTGLPSDSAFLMARKGTVLYNTTWSSDLRLWRTTSKWVPPGAYIQDEELGRTRDHVPGCFIEEVEDWDRVTPSPIHEDQEDWDEGLLLDDAFVSVEDWQRRITYILDENDSPAREVPGLGGGFGKTVPVRGIWGLDGLRSLPKSHADGIFLPFAMEKVPHESVPLILRDLLRVLKPGGRLSIMTQDTMHPDRDGIDTLRSHLEAQGFIKVTQLSGSRYSWDFDLPLVSHNVAQERRKTCPLVVVARKPGPLPAAG